jgi:medium-chain acyl-[acyl-carrier-protein] hydrolase
MITGTFLPASGGSDSTWFEHLSPARTPWLRVFCFPYAGGTADVYRGWQLWFPEQLDICLVHLPGHGRRRGERPLTSLISLVKALADRIETRIPYVLYGHSMGALICFELAHELCRRHESGPQHLFVSGCRAPQWPATKPPTFNLPHQEFVRELKRLNGTPQEVLNSPALMELFIDVLRADFEIVETYEFHPRKPLSCSITVYNGLHDEDVPIESCHAWQKQTSFTCNVKLFQGGHFFIRDPASGFLAAFRSDVMHGTRARDMRGV